MRRGLLAAVFALGCGGHGAAPVAVVQPPPPRPVALPAVEVEPAPRPLPRPYDAFHVGHPKALLSRVEALLRPAYPNLPPLDADTVAMLLTGDRVGSMLDMDQPIDVLVFDKDKLAGRAALREGAAPLLRERFHAVDAGGGKLRFSSEGRSCEARDTEIACASDRDQLALTLPYLRESARQAPASEVHSVLVLSGQPVATSSSDPTAQVMGTFLGEISELTLDLSTHDADAELTANARFSHAESPMARSLLAPPQNAPLDAFRRLPADARLAVVTTGLRADVLAPFRDDASRAATDELVSEGYPPDYVAELTAAARELVLTGGPLVMASGFDQAALERAEAGYRAAATDRTRAAVRAALTGYFVAGFDEEPARWVKGVRHIVEIDNRHVAKKKPAPGAAAPADKDKPKDDPWSCGTRLATVPSGVPRDGLHVEIGCHLKAQPKTTRTSHLLVVPDGHRTWLLYGADVPSLAAKAAGLLDARAATLATRKDVQRCLAGPSTLCASFSMLAGVPFFDDTTDEEIRASLARYDQMRAQPADPTSVVLAPGGGGDRLGLSAFVPLRAISGLLALVNP